MSVASITSTLGAGSGIDIGALVTSLVEAQYALKTDTLDKRDAALKAQVSATATLKSAITGFSTALSQLSSGGTLASAATSSDTAIVTAKTLPGANPGAVSTTLKVRVLAAEQVANSVAYTATPATVIGQGTMTFTLGTATVASNKITAFTAGAATPVTVTIDSTNSTLQGIVTAINAAATGVVASIVTDTSGSRLALKGASGEQAAFKVDVTESGGAGLAKFAVGINKTGTTIAQTAADAQVDVDGVAVKRPSNTITDIVAGVQLDLQSVNTTKTVSLGTTIQTESLRQAVNDTVTTFNELKAILNTQTDPQTGPLRTDTATKALVKALAGLVTTNLVPAGTGTPRTLAELGVGTNRDGTLSVNAAQLTSALTKWPATVEKMFATGTGATNGGIAAALKAISDSATSITVGLGASELRYTKLRTALTADQQQAADAAASLKTRLTRQFASMDSRVAAYKSTQAFLTNQVAAWNAND